MLKNLNKLGGKLVIEFSRAYTNEADAEDAKLSTLEAPPGVQSSQISSFKGEKFLPNWITSLTYLKDLILSDAFSILKFIGQEFLGITDNTTNMDVVVAFPKLLILELSWCPQLEEWEDIKIQGQDTIRAMPKLKCLKIDSCNKLKELPHRLISKATSLEELSFSEHIPSLSFNVQGSSVQQPSNLQLLNINSFMGKSMPNWILSLNHLIMIQIKNTFDLEDLPYEDIEAEEADTITVIPKLESLSIVSCDKLQVLPKQLLRKAPRLKKLEIKATRLLEESIMVDQQLMLHIEEIHINGTQLMHQSRRS
ncbi:hypothetical protein LIER_38909 [Lithospermum erythrorhizon]|uniref:Uncharacterized protein n=1 Tax=Lithospermum erythrorhizon TaxID=34254 RepID=A0AAV3Q6S2_LITER